MLQEGIKEGIKEGINIPQESRVKPSSFVHHILDASRTPYLLYKSILDASRLPILYTVFQML